MRTPFVIIALLLCAFVPLALREDEETGDGRPAVGVAEIAQRVEALRGLEFTEVPEPLEVSGERAKAEALAVLDRDYPPQARALDEDVFELLGLLPPGSDMRAIYGEIYGDAVGGYYDPEDGRLRVVTGGGTANDVIAQVTLAHELDHALEDQAIGFDMATANATDDPGLAYKALIEGSATALMVQYLSEHFPPDVAFAGALGGGGDVGATTDLPAFVNASLTFPYLSGQGFVTALRDEGGWPLVDEALRERPPVSTEQILHPQKWIREEAPDRVRLPAPAGWDRLGGGTLGEFQTSQWLRTSGPSGTDAAAGWGGDAYALYGRGDERLLVLRFAWDTPADEREFTERLPDVLAERGSGEAAFGMDDGEVTVVYAPSEALAQGLLKDDGG